MAVVLIDTIKNYIGLSSDTKPASPAAGSTFYETDTGMTHVFDGTAWQVRPSAGPFRATKSVTFDGTANLGQAGSNTTIFTVTGEVLIEAITGFCTVNLTEAAPTAVLSLGVTGSLALFIANTNSVDIDANEFWVDTAPDANGVALPAGLQNILITDNVLVAAATQDTDGGTLRIDCHWRPISPTGLLVPA